MNKKLLIDSLGWGIVLWLIGYILGFAIFFFLPTSLIGWIIMPIGVVITFWVLFKKVRSEVFWYYLVLAVVWTMIAVVLDYVFIVQMLKPEDGYYKLDVYLYYILTFIIPLLAYYWKKTKSNKS